VIEVDGVFAWLLKPAPKSITAPDMAAVPAVPASAGGHLEIVRAKALKAIGAGYGVLSRGPLHPSIEQLLLCDRNIEADDRRGQWRPARPAFTTPLSLRQLALLSAVYRTLEKRGVSCFANVWRGRLHACASIDEIEVPIDTAILRGRRASSWRKLISEQADAPHTARLIFRINSGETWADDETGPLEVKIPSIAAGVIVALEQARLIEGQRDAERRNKALAASQAALDAEAAAVAVEAEAKRVAALRRQASMLREADDIRRLVARVEATALGGAISPDDEALGAWCAWATRTAIMLDPTMSGEMLESILPSS
jgi:hypothetical protein